MLEFLAFDSSLTKGTMARGYAILHRLVHYLAVRDAPLRVRVARTLSANHSTHTLPSVEPVDLLQPTQLRIVPGSEIFTVATGVTCSLVLIHARDVPASRCVAEHKARLGQHADLGLVSNPCGNFSGTSSLKFRGTKGSIGHTFMVCIHTENQNQGDFYPFVLLEISVLHESPLGHLRYGLTDVPPQPNSPPDNVFNPDQPAKDLNARSWALTPSSALLNK